jgi:kinesin family protein 2/24
MNIEDQPKIRVVVRKRPLNKKEQQRGETDVVEVRSGSSVIVREQK